MVAALALLAASLTALVTRRYALAALASGRAGDAVYRPERIAARPLAPDRLAVARA